MNASKVTNSGPFGNYERGSAGHVLNAMCKCGVPIHIVEEVGFSNGPTLMYMGKEFCKYKYFDGIDQPLFRFENEAYNRQRMVVNPEARTRHPKFHLGLSIQDTPGLTIFGPEASVGLHEFIRFQCLSNDMRDPGYKLKNDSGAFFQGGSERPEGEFIFIEFWKPKGAQAFVDFINNNYVVKMDPKAS
jgi:hypothetical protein